MSRVLLLPCLALALFFSFTSMSFAQDRGTPEEAVAMVKRVKTMFFKEGALKTLKAIANQHPDYKDRDLYAFVISMEGVNVGHGVLKALIGKNIHKLQDADGKYIIQDFIRVARNQGSGWVDYKWPNPVTGKVDEKSSYIERINNNYFAGVGIYKSQKR